MTLGGPIIRTHSLDQPFDHPAATTAVRLTQAPHLRSIAMQPPSASISLPSLPSPRIDPAGYRLSLSGVMQKPLSFNRVARCRSMAASSCGRKAGHDSYTPETSAAAACIPVTSMPLDVATSESQSSEVEADPESQIPRAVSPAPTEIIDDPPVEDILTTLKSHGIKVRDFASPEEVRKTTVQPVTEIFDPFRGIAEFEYRVGSTRSRRPIPGKTLRRLLDLGWVAQEEVEERCAPMDTEALQEYDTKVAQDVKEGRGVYPWRALRWTKVPTRKDRNAYLLKNVWHLVAVDRARRHLEELDRREQIKKEEAEEDERLAREILERRRMEGNMVTGVLGVGPTFPEDWDSATLPTLFGATSRKRSLSEATGEGNSDNTSKYTPAYDGGEIGPPEDAHGSPKRIRLSPELVTTPPSTLRRSESLCLSPSPYMPTSYTESQSLSAPEKQYPAPLSSYDPEIYPEAAHIIGSQSQKHQQPSGTGDVATPPGTPRDELKECPLPLQSQPDQGDSPSMFQRGLRRKLARTQTCTFL